MAHARTIAGIVGPALVILGCTEAANMHIFAAQTAPVVFLNGFVLMVCGLVLVRLHNVWTRGWPVLITLTGWTVLAGGIVRMAVPDAPQIEAGPATYAMLAGIVVIGAILTWQGLRPVPGGDA